MSFLFINKTLQLNNLKTRTAMNTKFSVFVICIETIIYLLLYNLHDCTFNVNTEYSFVSCNNFEVAVQNNLTKSWIFLREISVAGFRYSETIVFGIHSNFTYDRSSLSKVFFKIGVLKNWPAKRFLETFFTEHCCFSNNFRLLL